MRTVPKLINEDGTIMLCGALCKDRSYYTFGKTPESHPVYCSRRAVYPDHRCAYHTAWLSGNGTERRRADNGRKNVHKARKVAWILYREQLTSADALITPVAWKKPDEEKK